MRIVSWNVWWRFGARWRERQAAIATTLESLRPDVVGLQEVWAADGTSQADVLADHLGMHACFAGPSLPPVPEPPESPDHEGVELGVGILSRWPVVRTAEHPLPARHRPERPIALMATLDHPAGPLHVVTAAVEWEPEYADDHLAQTTALAELLRDPALDGPLPVILTADLNAPPDSAQVRVLTEVMVDTWIAGGGDPDARTLRSDNPFAPVEAGAQIDRRIDYVLARPGTPARAVVVRSVDTAGAPVDGLHPSDHDAVVADLAE